MTERKRIVLILVGCGFVAALFGFLIFQTRRKIDDLETQTADHQRKTKAAQAEIRAIPERENLVIVNREVQERELRILPSEEQIANLWEMIQTHANESGVLPTDLPQARKEKSTLSPDIGIVPQRIRLRGSMKAFLTFMNRIENDQRLTSVKSFQIAAESERGKAEEVGGDPEHGIEMSIETYFFQPQKFQQANIKNYEARARAASIRNQVEEFVVAQVERYPLRFKRERRDPFVDVRAYAAPGDPEEQRRREEEELRLVEEAEDEAKVLLDAVKLENAAKQEGDVFRAENLERDVNEILFRLEQRIEQVSAGRLLTVPMMRDRFQKNVVAVVETVRARRPATSGAVSRLRRQDLEPRIEELEALAAREDYRAVEDGARRLMDLIASKTLDPDAEPLRARIEGLRAVAEAINRFNALGVVCTGVVYKPEAPESSVALINGRPYRPGQPVHVEDSAKSVVLKAVGRDHVLYEFEGQTVRRPLERAPGPDKKKPVRRAPR